MFIHELAFYECVIEFVLIRDSIVLDYGCKAFVRYITKREQKRFKGIKNAISSNSSCYLMFILIYFKILEIILF